MRSATSVLLLRLALGGGAPGLIGLLLGPRALACYFAGWGVCFLTQALAHRQYRRQPPGAPSPLDTRISAAEPGEGLR